MKNSQRQKNHNGENFWDRLLTAVLFPLRIFAYYFLMQFVFRILFRLGHKLRFDKNGKKLPKGNFVVLGNHVSNWDGIYINTYLKRFIYFIVHDELFKYWFGRVITHNICGQIKRGTATNDIGPLRKLMEIKDKGKCIGIFPEGDISFSGRTLEFDPSIAKLCKILGLPIVLVRIDGGSVRNPRWSREVRKVPIKLTVTDVISAQEVKAEAGKPLYNRIIAGISYNDSRYQRETGIAVTAKKPAENLENLLYLCPDCHSVGRLKSSFDSISCPECGYSALLSSKYTLRTVRGNRSFEDITAWDDYQKKVTPKIIQEFSAAGKDLITLDNFSYNRVPDGDFFYRAQHCGTLTLNLSGARFVSGDGNIDEFYPIEKIRSVYIQFLGAVEFSCGEYRYRFISKDGRHRGYWFGCFTKALQSAKL